MPKITVIVLTYNHENFIAQALDSILMQFGHFSLEILVSDDMSLDNTRLIITKYSLKYAELIKDISSDNIKLGISNNYKKCISKATGDYVAILEGDDYWIDSNKLEKQLQLINANKHCKFVFSSVYISDDQKFANATNQDIDKSYLTYKDFLYNPDRNLVINLSSCLIDKDILQNIPEEIYEYRFSEIPLVYYFLQKGVVGFCKTPLSVYRIHQNGVWNGKSDTDKLISAFMCRFVAIKVASPKCKINLYFVLKSKYYKYLINYCNMEEKVQELESYMRFICFKFFYYTIFLLVKKTIKSIKTNGICITLKKLKKIIFYKKKVKK